MQGIISQINPFHPLTAPVSRLCQFPFLITPWAAKLGLFYLVANNCKRLPQFGVFFSCCLFSFAVCFLLPSLLVSISVVVAMSQGAWWHYGIFGCRMFFSDNFASPQHDLRAHRDIGRAMQPNRIQPRQGWGGEGAETGHLPLHGWGHRGLLKGFICLSHLINWDNCQISFPSFLHLCSLQSGLPEICSRESARWDLPVLAAVLTPLPTMVPPTGYTSRETPPSPFLPLTYSKHPLVFLLFWQLIELLWQSGGRSLTSPLRACG